MSNGPPSISWPVDTPIDQIIGEAIGAASVCWSNPGGAGVFDAERASAIVDAVMDVLRRKLWTDAWPDEALVAMYDKAVAATPCRAARWHGEPTIEGPHPSHFFTYGPHGMYTGSCSGR